MDNPPLVAELKADARVDLVQYDAAWRRKLSDILGFGERIVAVIAALLALATLLVIGNTVRMDIQARSEEIAVMQLIGASNGFVRRPFLYSGLWYGLLGGVCALLIVGLVELALSAPLDRLLESYAHRFTLRGLALPVGAGVLLASGLLGWFGAFVATARHLAAGRPNE
jgi:cell division transport system permease protein